MNSKLFVSILICCPSIHISNLNGHLIMMDNEIVTIEENMMMGPKSFLKKCSENHFHQQFKQFKKYCHRMNVKTPHPPFLLTTLYCILWKTKVP